MTKEQEQKFRKVLREFKEGKLKTSHGDIVTDRDQALAIAFSEALGKGQVNYQELINEHKHLINVLLSPSHYDDIMEAKKQAKELKQYEQEIHKSSIDLYLDLKKSQSSTPSLVVFKEMEKIGDLIKGEYGVDVKVGGSVGNFDLFYKGISLAKAIDTSKLVRKKIQITNPKTGKTYWAYRWINPNQEDLHHEGTKTSKYFNELKGTGVEKIQQIISDDRRNKTDKVRDLVALGVFNKKLLCQLTAAGPATPYDIIKQANIPKDIERQRPDLSFPTSSTPFPTPAKVNIDTGEIEHSEETTSSFLEQELEALILEEGIQFEEDKINPITGKDSVDETMDIFADMVAKKLRKLAIFYGVGGVGKTYGVKQILTNPNTLGPDGKPFNNELVEYDPEVMPDKDQYDFIKITGKVTPQKLFRTLYEHNGKLILFDDCDSILQDEDSVNMLKAATDTTLEAVTYDGAPIKSSDGETKLPKSFFFRGSVIIISNLSEDKLREKASPLLESRALSLDTSRTMDETIDKLDRIKDLMPFEDANGDPIEVSKEAREAAIEFVRKYKNFMPVTQVNGRTLGALALTYQTLGIKSKEEFFKHPTAQRIMNVTKPQIIEFLKKQKMEEAKKLKKQQVLINSINKYF